MLFANERKRGLLLSAWTHRIGFQDGGFRGHHVGRTLDQANGRTQARIQDFLKGGG